MIRPTPHREGAMHPLHPLARGAAAAAALLAAAAAPAAAQLPAGPWRMTFTGGGMFLETVVELRPDSAHGRMEGTLVGTGGASIRLEPGPVEGRRFTLRAVTPRGGMLLHGEAEGGTMRGTWSAENRLARAFVRGTMTGKRVAAGALAPLGAADVVDSVHATVARAFFDPAFGGADWGAVGREFHARAGAVEGDGEVVALVREMLGRLGATHLAFFAAPGGAAGPPAAERVVSWRRLSARTGYVRIAWFPPGEAGTAAGAALDSAFAELGPLPGLVVDLRGNPGGGLELASRLGAHLSAAPLPAGWFATAAGLRRHGARTAGDLDPATLPRLLADASLGDDFHARLEAEGGAAMLVTPGGGAGAYAGRVVVLVDRGSASTAEAVAAALGESGRATVAGTRTAGAMLSSTVFEIAKGWMLQVPVADYRSARGVRIEGAGVQPEVVLPGNAAGDGAVERARRILEAGAGAGER